jgi:SAM-dependent methyltransferase
VDLPVSRHSLWSTKGNPQTNIDIGWVGIDLLNFREGAYAGSYAGWNPMGARLKYYIFSDAVRRKDTMQLLAKLEEDDAFGCTTFEFAGLPRVSRDLLDSVVELNFLHKHMKILNRDLRVLDIGAGYGRMAHRMMQANPRIQSYTCVDAVPESTFLCEFYLRYRNVPDSAQVIPLDNLQQTLAAGHYDLALNIHSFSECTFEAIEWWLSQLRLLGVGHLMIVPNHPEQFLSFEADRSQRDYAPLLQKYGYSLAAREPVFDDPAVQEILVKDSMFLFRSNGT